MKPQRLLGILGLGCFLVFSWSCKRTALEDPLPVGPSTFGLTFELEARPNVIMATEERSMSSVRATVKKNGIPVKDSLVYFTILTGPGEFSDYNRRTAAFTDMNGVAEVTYIGPTSFEISADTLATIKSQLETTTPDYIHKQIDIRILIEQ